MCDFILSNSQNIVASILTSGLIVAVILFDLASKCSKYTLGQRSSIFLHQYFHIAMKISVKYLNNAVIGFVVGVLLLAIFLFGCCYFSFWLCLAISVLLLIDVVFKK